MFFSVFRCVRVPSPQHLLDNSTGDASTLRAQLNAEVEGRRVDGVTAEERLRKELQDLRQSLVAEWAERVEQEVQRARKVHQQEVSDLVRKHEQEMESARAEHLSQVEALEKKIHTLQEDASRQGNEASRLLVRSRQEHAEQMKNLQEEQQRMSEETRDRHAKEMERLHQEHRDAVSRMQSEHQQALLAIRESLAVEAEEASQRKLNDLRNTLSEEHAKTLSEAQEQHKRQLRASLENLEGRLRTEMRQLEEQHAKVLEEWAHKEKRWTRADEDSASKIRQLQASVGNLESSKAQLTDDLQEAHQTLKLRGMEFDRAKRELQEEMVERERQIQQRKKEEMAEYHRLHAEEIARLKEEFAHAKDLFSQKDAIWQQKCEELENRYRHRPSREDDIELIRQLQEEIMIMEQQLARAVEDMKIYKLELQNREEVYNRTFGRQPSVGLVNPFDQANKKQAASKGGKSATVGGLSLGASSSTFPSIGAGVGGPSGRSGAGRPPSARRGAK